MFVGDIKLPARVQEAMQMQVEAERKKRATVLESEGRLYNSYKPDVLFVGHRQTV